MTPVVVVVSHTHWDREWYQPFEVFRARLCTTVEELVDLLDRDDQFRHFMLDGQTICLDDVLEVRPDLASRIDAHIGSGRIGIGPWYVLQDEFLVGAESIVRNLHEGLTRAGSHAMRIGYLPDAFGHIAQMPRILRGMGIDTAVVWRGVGRSPPAWRWRALSGHDVLCLSLPGGYGNAHSLSEAEGTLTQEPVTLWMNGNDHQRANPNVPAQLAEIAARHPTIAFEHASLQRAVELVRARTGAFDVRQGELRTPTPTAPVLSGTWSSRSWQKARHDRAEGLLTRVVEPLCAWAGHDVGTRSWRLLLQCQPHDSICGCSIDEVHRDIDARLRAVEALAFEQARRALQSICSTPTADFALHDAIAIANPHPYAASAIAEVAVQRRIADGPFRLLGPTGEAPYEMVARTSTDGPDKQPAEWLQLRIYAHELPPLGVRTLEVAPGEPKAIEIAPTIRVRKIRGGVELTDRLTGSVLTHTFEEIGDRGDLYDFCPEGDVRSSRDHRMGIFIHARVIDRRVEFDVEIDQQSAARRLRARFDLPGPLVTDTPFGWIARADLGTHPVSSTSLIDDVAIGGPGLHEVERVDDALYLTLFRAVGWMSRGDLSTRNGHAGYNVPTPDAQGIGTLRFRYAVSFAGERGLAPGLVAPFATPLVSTTPSDRAFLAIEPVSVRLSIVKRAYDSTATIVRLTGPRGQAVTASLTWHQPIVSAHLSDLDERVGAPLAPRGNRLDVPIAANDVVTVRLV